MVVKGDKIKTAAQLQSSIRRIAYQIYENNLDEKELILAGIGPRGSRLAQRFGKALEGFSTLKISYGLISINKAHPIDGVSCDLPLEAFQDKSIVVVDDVLNTGSTLLYAVQFFLQIPVKQIKTAVIVNRNHKRFPIKADFKGISLSTSLNEHVSVVLEGDESGIYLR